MSENGYYGSLLTGKEAEAYRAMLLAFPEMKKEFRVPAMAFSRLTEIFEMLRLDRPELFYLSGLSFGMPGEGYLRCVPEYLFNPDRVFDMRKALETRVSRILRPAEDVGEVRALSYIRDWIFRNVHYEKLEKQYSHEVYGVLSHGIGVCEGIAKTAKLFADRLHIPSVVVIGEKNEENVRHAWNIFYLYGKPKHYDLTYDLSRLQRGEKPIYAAMSDKQIYKNHRTPVYPVPVCL